MNKARIWILRKTKRPAGLFEGFRVCNFGSKQPYFNSSYEVRVHIFSFRTVERIVSWGFESHELVKLMGKSQGKKQSKTLSFFIIQSISVANHWFIPGTILLIKVLRVSVFKYDSLITRLKGFSPRSQEVN